MRHGSLESGVGMFDYAAEMMGWKNVFHCEINPFCQTVLNYYWTKAKSYANVFGFDGTEWRGKVDIITAGFPCQPFSNAGKRKGSTDDRHIWPENMRIFREAQPTFIVCENVPGLLTIEDGMVFEQVCLDLENEGYEVQTFIIPAVATDKDHRRDRLWIVAHSDAARKRRNERKSQDERNDVINSNSKNIGFSKSGSSRAGGAGFEDSIINVTNTVRSRQQGQGQHRRPCNTKENENWQINRTFDGHKLKESWLEAATRLCGLFNGVSAWLDRNIRRLKIDEYADKIKNVSEQDLPILWERIQSQKIWEKIRRCDKIQQQAVLLAILCQLEQRTGKGRLSDSCKEIGESGELLELWYNRKFGDSSYRRKLEEQRSVEFEGFVSQLSHEIALDGVETYSKYFNPKWRTESLKAYGNTIVWEIAYEIFKAIEACN